jgi:hypothetical protein
MAYIAKIPITVYTKKARSPHIDYVRDEYTQGYLYLDIDNGGNIRMVLRFGNSRVSYKIHLPKWGVFQMFLYHLALRPIYKTDCNLWVDEKIENPVFHEDIDHILPEKIMSSYSRAVQHLHRIIPRMSEKGREMAEKQLENLLSRERKIDVINQIQKSNDVKTDGLPWDHRLT